MLALSTVLLAALAFAAPGPTALDSAVHTALDAIPLLFGWFWEISYDLVLGWAVVLLVLGIAGRGRKTLLRDQVLSALVAAGASTLVAVAAGTSLSALVREPAQAGPPGVYPAVRLAFATAVIVTTSPHLSHPLRGVGRWVLTAGAVSVVALGVAPMIGALAGLFLGLWSAALVHLCLGSPGGRLPLEEIAAELADLGVAVTDVRHAALEPRGVALATARADDGSALVVKVYGRDAWEGSLLTSVWSSLWYRVRTPATRVGRLQQVEHEAFVSLLAERADVPVLPVVAAGMVWDRDALLVTRVDGRLLADISADEVGAGLGPELWLALGRLHAAGIAHGHPDRHHLVVRGDGTPAFGDFSAATCPAADHQLLADRAQLLVTLALVAGPDQAVADATAALGRDGLAGVLPYLQPAALDSATRRALRSRDWDVSDLRQAAAAATGVEPPKLQQLRRVTVGSVLGVAVLILVAYAVISAIVGVGLDTIVQEFEGADWWWVASAVVLSPFVQVGQAVATQGASVRQVRLGPVLALQYAVQFLGLAVPSSAARIALEIRFFQKVGTTATAAVAVGVIDSVSGFVVQLVIIAVTLLSGLVTLDFPNENSSGGSGSSLNVTAILVVGGLLLLVAAAVALTIPRVRAFLRSRAADSVVALAVLRSPRKVGLLLSGNLVAQVLQAIILGCSVRAFGEHASFAELILINTLVSLFAGLMPVPGGIGVTEAALTAGLVAVGVPDAAALAAAIVYRMATYYLPPVWGAFAMRWLRTHAYI
jgi:uncharacterized membrane protein YbhN (UPF0104 family)